jgi:hypothetical protein
MRNRESTTKPKLELLWGNRGKLTLRRQGLQAQSPDFLRLSAEAKIFW